MPCVVDICGRCRQYDCQCRQPEYEARRRRSKRAIAYDYEGALCDVLTLVEKQAPTLLDGVDPKILAAWREHQARDAKGEL